MIEPLTFSPAAAQPRRDTALAMRRGLFGRCPKCGEGKLFRAYLKVADNCPSCGEAMHHQRADDAPAYFTMLIVGHFIVAGIMATEMWWPETPALLLSAGWAALAAVSSLWLLPHIKGLLVGYQWALRMHGFGERETEAT